MTTTTNPTRRKVYVEGPGDVRVPFAEVPLGGGEDPVRLYDTSGPGSDPAVGLAPTREAWIVGRGDVESYGGRPVDPRDDGRASVRGGAAEERFAGAAPGAAASPARPAGHPAALRGRARSRPRWRSWPSARASTRRRCARRWRRARRSSPRM